MPGAQDWATPPAFFTFLDSQFHFDIDVCASAENAKCENYLTKEDDAFVEPWFTLDLGGDVEQNLSAFCNPGFAEPLKWHKRAFEQCNPDNGYMRFACVLGIAGASQEWFEFAYNNTLMIIHLSPRVQYLAPPGVKQSSNNYESVVYVYSSLPACPGNIQYRRWDPTPRRKRKVKA